MSMTKTAPKKYADARRTVITDEWYEWEEDRHAEAADDGWEEAMDAGLEAEKYFPERDGKAIPEDGAWILVFEEPHTEMKDRFTVPPISMWRARKHEVNAASFTTKSGVKFWPQQAVITTPGGDLHLWPHEYTMATRPMDLASDPDAELHSLGGEVVLDEEKMFYLQSRGIPRSEATLMLFDTIKSLDFVYVTFPEWLTSMFAGVGQTHHRNSRRSSR